MNISIKFYQLNHRSLWDEFCYKNRGVDFTYQRRYLEYRNNEINDKSLIFEDNDTGKLCGVFPLAMPDSKSRVVVSHPYLTFGGCIVSKEIDIFTYLELLEKALCQLTSEGFIALRYRCRPTIYESVLSVAAEYMLTRRHGSTVNLNLSSIIKLKQENTSSSRRTRALKKASKSNLSIRKLDSDLSLFWRTLECEIAERYNSKLVHTYNDFTNIRTSFSENILCYGVFSSERLISGAIIYVYSNVWKLQYSFSTIEGRNLNAIDWLYSNLLKKARSLGFEYFDFGTSNNGNEMFSIQRGLFEFKMGFGCSLSTYRTLEVPLK